MYKSEYHEESHAKVKDSITSGVLTFGSIVTVVVAIVLYAGLYKCSETLAAAQKDKAAMEQSSD